jgi:cytochrome b561
MSDTKRYSTTMVILHWALALAILGAIFMGSIVLDDMESDHPQKILLLKLHILIGLSILAFTLFRLVIRFTSQLPAPLPESNPLLEQLGKVVHYVLYLFTILTTLSGIYLAISAELPAVLLNNIGVLPKDYEDFIAHEAHDIFANLLLLTIALHVAAAIYHQFILKDGLISRMSFRKEK